MLFSWSLDNLFVTGIYHVANDMKMKLIERPNVHKLPTTMPTAGLTGEVFVGTRSHLSFLLSQMKTDEVAELSLLSYMCGSGIIGNKCSVGECLFYISTVCIVVNDCLLLWIRCFNCRQPPSWEWIVHNAVAMLLWLPQSKSAFCWLPSCSPMKNRKATPIILERTLKYVRNSLSPYLWTYKHMPIVTIIAVRANGYWMTAPKTKDPENLQRLYPFFDTNPNNKAGSCKDVSMSSPKQLGPLWTVVWILQLCYHWHALGAH